MDHTNAMLSYILTNKLTVYVSFLLLCSCACHGATGINHTQFDLGATITKITSNDFSDIYLGGVNFVAQLSINLDLLFNLSIGPVNEWENCAPNPAPCDNTVMVLEIDKAHNMLLVCGTAYQGTCTLHRMDYIFDWYCLTGDRNEGGADIVAGQQTQPVVAHFLPPTNLSVTPMIGIDMFPSECRAVDFGQMMFNPEVARSRSPSVSSGGRRNKPKGSTHFADFRPKNRHSDFVPFYDGNGNTMPEIEGEDDLDGEIEEPIEFSTFASTLMIAGNVDNGSDTSTTPMLLSLRHLVFAGTEYKISYAQGKDGKPVGLNIKPEMKSSFFIQYKFSFTWEQFSYFVMLREGTCREGNKHFSCVVTKIGRTCNDPSSLLPYVEVPLKCIHGGKEYNLLTSATLGTVGLQTRESYVTVPVLLAAFGNGSYPMSTTADPKYGGAVCAFSLDTFNDQEIQFSINMCDMGHSLIQTAQWVSGSTYRCVTDTKERTCTSETKNPYISSEDLGTPPLATKYLPDVAVAKILTHTQTVQNVPAEKMTVYLLTSSGQIEKFTLRAKKDPYYRLESSSELIKYTDLEYTVSMQDTQPSGIIDHKRAVMYISKGHKIIGLSLDFCRQYQTCSACRERPLQCRWCPEENTCLDVDTAEDKTKCPTASETTCPPRLEQFKPTHVPTKGGSMLTLIGVHLGVSGEGMVNVTVCDEPCDAVLANQKNITCMVRHRCNTCAEECNITVFVQGQAESDGFTSTYVLPHRPVLKYVNPQIESFSPKFGPASGSTMVTFEGEHIRAGSNTKIKVAGADCALGHLYSLECGIFQDKQRSPHCGSVVVSIDNFEQTLSEDFCFRPDPTIEDITPMASIMSGGVTVTVTGSNLNSVASPRLILTLSRRVDDKSEAYNYISECSLIDESKMTCDTPDVTDAISRRRETGDKNNYITAELQIDMDGADAMATLAGPHQMRVHQDPALYPILADSDDAHISSPLRDFTIRGQNIPTWIHWADISVTIGETTCPVTAVTQDLISCDVTNVLKMYKEDSLILDNNNKHNDGSVKTTTSSIISDSNTTQPATEQSDTTTASITSRRVRHRRELSSNDMMLLSMILVPNNSSNVTDTFVNTTEMEMNFTTTTSLPVTDTTTDKTTDSQSHRKLLSYLVMARIGNYEATLGNVTVGPRNENETRADPETDPDSGKLDFKIIAGAGGAGFLVLVLVVFACAMYCRAKKASALVKEQAFYMGSLSGSQHGSKEAATMSLKQILESVIEPHKRADMDKLIITLDRLTVGKSIGSGNFGCVYEGLLESKDDSPAVKVAVKTLQDPLSHNINLQEFVQEAVIMKDFRHPHVLGLVGLAEKEPGVPYVILPYMDSGDLLTFIRDTSVSLSLHDVIKFGADIASGMAYLSALKFVHRDLAARNCMLDSVHRVKVADFGLCRDIYEKGYYTSDNKKKLPIRWMAMESIEQGAYSTKSDAWSLGVVLWELLTRGVTPYPGVDGWDIINFLRFRRLAPPFFCPEELYNLMMQCWAKDPNMRPTFTVIQTELLKMIGQTPPAADTLTPTLKRSHALSTQSVSSNKSAEDTLSKQNPNAPKPVPRITVKQKSDEKPEAQPRRHLWKDSEKAGENKEEKDKEKGDSDTVVQSKQKVLKNVMITIPACYAHRDVSRTAAGTYIQLVDNYEPPPKFSHPLKRSKKKSSKRTAERQGADNQKGEQSPKTITGAYSVPENNAPLRSSAGSYLTDNPDAGVRGSEGSLIGRVGKEGNYYVLERDSIRTSDTSDMDSRTSSMLMNTDSMPSLRDSHSHSRCSSTYSGSRASGISNLSALNTHRHSNTASHAGPAVHKKSPLVTTRKSAWEDVKEQSEGASEEKHDLMTSL